MSHAILPRPALPPELDPRAPRRRRSSLRRLSLVSCSLLSTLVLALSGVGWFLYNQFDSNITRNSGWNVGGNRPAEVPGSLNILLLGDDSRDGTGNEYGGEAVEGNRSDTTIIAHFDKDGTATLLSFPRDELIKVVVPASAAKEVPRDGRDKLTNVMTYGGVPGLITTLEALTDLHIDHTVKIDLAGFKQITDAIGGVTVCVTRMPNGSTTNLNDNYSQWHGQLGENHLNGDQALAFVRTRHALGDERLRILRQQQFLSKLLTQATSTGVLTNPAKITSLLGAVGGAIEMDSSLDQTELIKLADRVSKLGSGKVKFVTVPTHIPVDGEGGATGGNGTVSYHGAVLFINTEEFEQILAPLRPASPQDAAVASAAPVAPAQVVVASIANASGRQGLAAATAADLRKLGFGGFMAAKTATADQSATEVHYAPGQESAAKTLVARIPGARAVADATLTGSGLELVLGSSFTGVTGAAGPTAASAATGAAPAAGAAGTAAPTTTAPLGSGGIPADTSCTP
ncbi:LCP family protein [Pseudofrankia sp. BMG5.37]|uniref:LCP family protein n=1 Tax=Pseudofrankia sp. BMG5.37 TaxID=3050035 RepID=UPI0028939E91|nr:LCP family protein [Pseudofrankia sp. BMG5.37]MDT3438421.1 LCP family protein [Pseudofrankia sp. BMG5.37]